jgi:outer membrane protein
MIYRLYINNTTIKSSLRRGKNQNMRLSGGWSAASCMGVALLVAGTNAYGQWWKDPFHTDQKIAPAPDKQWEPRAPLPTLPATSVSESLPADKALTLPELTEFALRNNPRTRQAWYAAQVAAANLGVTLGDTLPQVAGSYSVARTRPISNTNPVNNVSWLNRWGPQIGFNYVIFDFGGLDARIDAAEYRLLAANLSQNRVLQEVIFQVEQAYYQVIGVEALVRVNQQTLKNIETVLDAARRRRESGLATVADVYRAETQVAQAQLTLTRSRGEFEKARGQLSTVVGLPISSTIRVQTLTGPPQTAQAVTAINDYLERVKSIRPDLVAAEAQARAARATALAASKAGLPSIEISGLSQHSNWANSGYLHNPDRPATNAHNLTLNIRIPIFSGFKDTYSIRQAEALAQQAEAARDSIYRQTQLEVWQSYYDLQTVTGSIGSTEAVVKSAEQTAQATLARYQSGFGTILDLITAQQDEAFARTQRIQSYLDWYTVLARLHLAVGANGLMTMKSESK